MKEILMLFKLNIGVTSDAKKPLFEARIKSAIQELARKGININENDADDGSCASKDLVDAAACILTEEGFSATCDGARKTVGLAVLKKYCYR